MKKLYEKLISIQDKGVFVPKSGENPHYKSKYMRLDDIVDTLSDILKDKKLLCVHFINAGNLVTRIVDMESGEQLDSSFPLQASDPQKKGSEITYAKRYNLVSIFNICADEDDDGNKASGKMSLYEIKMAMDIETDLENLKTLFNQGMAIIKDKAEQYELEKCKDKNKNRILKLNPHTA